MAISRRVCLYGNSVILGTVGASLRRRTKLEVTAITQPVRDGELDAMKPDVILFDLEAPRPEAAFSLLERRPGLLVIGVSPDTNVVKMWSGRQLRELSMTDLLKAIDEHGTDSPGA